MTNQNKTYYQSLNTLFLDENHETYTEGINFIGSICLALINMQKEQDSDSNKLKKNIEYIYLSLLSLLISGENCGSNDAWISILLPSKASAPLNSEEGDCLEYDIIRGLNGVNVVAFTDAQNCLVVETSLAILEIIKMFRTCYRSDISEFESPVFQASYRTLAKVYGVENRL